MPGIKTVGTNTAVIISASATTGPATSCIAFSAASFGDNPSSMWRSTDSTTTIESSTTNPIASTRPNIESVLMEKPKSGNNMNAPTSETGTAHKGMIDARQPCKKMYTTRITNANAFHSVLTISSIPWLTARVVSSETA